MFHIKGLKIRDMEELSSSAIWKKVPETLLSAVFSTIAIVLQEDVGSKIIFR